MANSAIEIPFYVAVDGSGLVGGASEMVFESLLTLGGVDKSANCPSISEIGGGWYKFVMAFGVVPFDEGDLVGVIDADKNGTNSLMDNERYIPVEVRLDYYALMRLVYRMSQDKLSGEMTIKNDQDETIISLGIVDGESAIDRVPGA
jgi:hypothetical protein